MHYISVKNIAIWWLLKSMIWLRKQLEIFLKSNPTLTDFLRVELVQVVLRQSIQGLNS